jgi:hypothetical protein
MMKRTAPAPMLGAKATFEEKLAAIRSAIRDQDRQIEASHRESLSVMTMAEKVDHLTRQGRQVHELVNGFLASAGLPDTTAERVKALGVLREMKVTDGVSPSDLQVVLLATKDAVLASGKARPLAPISESYVPALTFTAADGTTLAGDDLSEARRLGGGERWSKLRAIAKRESRDLNRVVDRTHCEALLFAEVSSTVACAKSFAEAMHVVQREDPKLSTRDAAERVRSERPDLVDVPVGRRQTGNAEKKLFASRESAESRLYSEVERLANIRSLDAQNPATRAQLMREVSQADPSLGRALYYGEAALDPDEGDDTPRTSGVVALSEDEDKVKKFAALVDEAIREQGLPNTYENRSRAAAALRKTRADLVPVYGSGKRS